MGGEMVPAAGVVLAKGVLVAYGLYARSRRAREARLEVFGSMAGEVVWNAAEATYTRLPAGEWVWLCATQNVPRDLDGIYVRVQGRASDVQAGDWIDVTGGLVQAPAQGLVPYWDGSSASDEGEGFSYSWAGAENSSESVAKARRFSGSSVTLRWHERRQALI